MPEIHLPHLEEDEDEPASQPVSTPASLPETARPHRRYTWLKLILEVVLITTGVFLGLAGESWRESREHRELAAQSLRRFRDEFRANRAEVLRVHQRHLDEETAMLAYFEANGPALMAHQLDPKKPI